MFVKVFLPERFRGILRPYSDPVFYLTLMPGLAAFLLPETRMAPPLFSLAVAAFIEELIFRFGLQHLLGLLFPRQTAVGITWANLTASLVFTGMHFFSQPPLWAAGVFLPSLVFGWIWDRYENLSACFSIHFFYNLCFFYLPSIRPELP